ncbi:MAG: hypothetical protein KDC12_14495 [Flavobacteriales bacterium]|nr:hypothetical protein [Flavobacteriales bacterium]
MRILLTFVFGFIGVLCFAQDTPSGKWDEVEGRIGLTASAIYGHVSLDLASVSNAPLIYTVSKGGGSLGAVYQVRLNQKVHVRPAVQFSIINNDIVFENQNGEVIRRKFLPGFVEVPVHFIYSGSRFGRSVEALFGVKLSQSAVLRANDEFSVRSSLWSAEFGLGKEFHIGRRQIYPEILVSLGVNNLYRYSSIEIFARHIERMVLHQIALRVSLY